MADTETRPLRICDSCGGVDDHPRHVFATAAGDGATPDDVAKKALENAEGNADALLAVVRAIKDDGVIMKHMDCCREDGCPDGTCSQVTAGAEDLRGDDLVAHLTKEN